MTETMTDVWSIYENRVATSGDTKRRRSLNREQRLINNKLKDSLSYQSVYIDDVKRKAAVINSDNLNEKTIISLSKDEIYCGGLVYWMDNYWLITELDASVEVYTKAKMKQCNYLLKWIDEHGKIHQQWCIVEDGTKYLTGEYEDRNFIVTRGDSRISMTIAKNKDTTKFSRESRFLIDDPESSKKLSFSLTKPLKVGWVYGARGVYVFVLQEVVSTEFDNHELGIADYFKYYPDNDNQSEDSEEVGSGANDNIHDNTGNTQNPPVINPNITENEDGRQVWL